MQKTMLSLAIKLRPVAKKRTMKLGTLCPPPPGRLLWPLSEGSLETEETVVSVLATNDSDEALILDCEIVGDLGTTRTHTVPLESVEVASGAEVAIPVNVALLSWDAAGLDSESGSETDSASDLDTPYSARFHVACGTAAATTESIQKEDFIVSPSLFFHQQDEGVIFYDEATLFSSYRAGDYRGLLDETEQLVDPESNTFVSRVVEYAEPPETDDDGAEAADTTEVFAPIVDGSSAEAPETLTASGSPSAFPWPHTICARLQIQTFDGGYTNSAGMTEDIWPSNGAITVNAPRMRIRVGSTTYDTNASGCVTWWGGGATWHDVRVFALATDTNDSLVRMHNAHHTTTDPYPGSTYSILVTGVVTYPHSVTFVDVGGHGARWTAMAALAQSLNRYNDWVYDTQYHVAQMPSNACQEPNQNYHNDIPNKRSYIRLHHPSCHGTNMRAKFVVAHEYGHAYAFQHAQKAFQSPASYDHYVLPSDCDMDPDFYGNDTKEWSSIGIREGIAHFVSARVWNNEDSDGQFRWGVSRDLARWDPSEAPGGFLHNECCPYQTFSCQNSLDGAGNIPDWMRAFWALHNGTPCKLSKGYVGLLYRQTINSGGLLDWNFYFKSHDAISTFWFPSECAGRWAAVGCHHGIDRDGTAWSGC